VTIVAITTDSDGTELIPVSVSSDNCCSRRKQYDRVVSENGKRYFDQVAGHDQARGRNLCRLERNN
jgi:hypothetical protein